LDLMGMQFANEVRDFIKIKFPVWAEWEDILEGSDDEEEERSFNEKSQNELDIEKESRYEEGKIIFIGHSIGGLIIRSGLSTGILDFVQPIFHTFVTLGSPHLGCLYGSQLVSTGMWALTAWNKTEEVNALSELNLEDGNGDLEDSLLFRLLDIL